MLKLWIKHNNYLTEWIPNHCSSEISQKEKVTYIYYQPWQFLINDWLGQCNIHYSSSNEERRCFDIAYPFSVYIPQYYCYDHNRRFRSLQLDIPLDIICTIDNEIMPIFVTHKSIMTTRFWFNIVNLYQEYHNMSAITRLVQKMWRNTLNIQLQSVSQFLTKVLLTHF